MRFGINEIRFVRDHLKNVVTLQADRSLYLALAEVNRRHGQILPTAGEKGPSVALTPFELRVFSQNGEDGVLAEILRRIGAPGRFFVEFGVESGREGNCVYLADVEDWRGLFMEGDGACFRQLAQKYAELPRITTVQAMVAPDNVESLFAGANVPEQPDVLSMDIDGSDYWVWEAIRDYQPRVVIVEYNSAIDPRRPLVQPKAQRGWDETEYYGASIASLERLGESKGYRLVHTELSGVNAFFVRSDLAADRFPASDDVARRGAPNYFQRGYRHRPANSSRSYLDLDSGDLVSVTEAHG
ncbi:MAG: hypothetical protein QOG59_1076 [Solirubrobacteraceae bacterium]|jgi:hypothetical protein|nr:hypothetical protein [Solirubrobacteraceae bacterium]